VLYEKLVALLRTGNDVEYKLSNSEILEELKRWRRAPEKRGILGGVQPRMVYARVMPDAEHNIVSAHRRLVLTLYAVEPSLGRLLVRRAGYKYAQTVLDGIDSIEDSVLMLARKGVGMLDFKGCKSKRCKFRLYNCLTCSSIEPAREGDSTLCEWEAGILEYIAEKFLRSRALVKETRCWHIGYSFCEFVAILRG